MLASLARRLRIFSRPADAHAPTLNVDMPAPNVAPIGHKVVLLLALPVLAEQLLNAGVSYVDVILAGRISKEATTAVGFASYVGWFVTSLSWLVATGATALVSRHVGSGDRQRANRFANQTILLSLAFGFFACALVQTLAAAFIRWQGFTPAAATVAITYLRIDSMGYLLYGVMLGGAAALRGAGDTRTPMFMMGVINIINAIVSIGLVYGLWVFPRVGVNGIAVGTLVARLLGGLLMLVLLWRGRSGLRLHLRWLRPIWDDLRRLCNVGVPASIDGAVTWAGHFIFLMMIGRIAEGDLGTAAYAAHIVGVRIEAFSYMPAMAWGTAAATLVGQGLGARRIDVSRRRGIEAAKQVVTMMCVVGACYFIFARQLFALFSDDPAVWAQGVLPLRVLAFFQPALGLMIVMVFILRGAGDSRFPLVGSFIGVWLVRLPVAYLLIFHGGLGLLGAWLAMAGDLSLRAALMSWRFHRGAWAHVRV